MSQAVTPFPPQHPTPTVRQAPTRGRLTSSAVNKGALRAVTQVMDNTDLLRHEGKMGTMAGILAKQSSFGKDVMLQCTAKGYGDKPELHIVELMELKEEMQKL